jgi:uncharacterized protein
MLEKTPTRSFFVWGTRQTGKSTLLKQSYPTALLVDLLKSDEFVRYSRQPSLLREEIVATAKPSLVIIDEVQKVPSLLDEVHWLIENCGIVFALCGSSARKLKRGHANLLGGRALRYELFGLISSELEQDFDLIKLLNRGYIPNHFLASDSEISRLIRSYVVDYLKEEVAAEALVRSIATFSDFLERAALSDTETVSYSSFARDVGVSANTIREYYSILVDTHLGCYLESYTKRPKRRVVATPKFFFGDVGVVNSLARRGILEPGSELFGKAFENWVMHELRAYNEYASRFQDLYYWRLSTGVEVDFVVGSNAVLAIEAKATKRVTSDHLKGLRELRQEHPHVGKQIVVSLEEKLRKTEDGIEILPYDHFCQRLWSGELF